MNKIIAMLLIITMAFVLLAGCGSTSVDGITVISREDGSGTRGAFVELFKIEEKDADGNKVDLTTEDADITNNTSVMMTSVSGNERAIGYISLGSLNDTVKALKIDGAAATVENIKFIRSVNRDLRRSDSRTPVIFMPRIKSSCLTLCFLTSCFRAKTDYPY